ncbi:MAG: AraC family transcriptional regulator [Bacteroidia bacterium]|nr:AraC family transcriptional regulator [Bacteroidia bacterium]
MNVSFFVPIDQKNNEKNRVEFIRLDDDFSLVKVNNASSELVKIRGELDPGLIQFYFCTAGTAEFSFHHGAYVRKLEGQNAFLFYNPSSPLPHDLNIEPNTRLLALFVSVKKLHQLFINDSDELAFLNNENINKKYYASLPISTALAMVIEPLHHFQISEGAKNLYYRGKIFEILSLYFSREDEKSADNCPFLHDEQNVEKIRQAKKILLDRMSEPPALPELAREVGLNEYQLKVGFKNIYGNTVYKFLTDHRMDQARKMLDTGNFRVNEVSFHIGFTNPSHFIAAFRKKFGITPKKYLQFIGR